MMTESKTVCPVCRGDVWDKIPYCNKFHHALFDQRFIAVCMTCGLGQIEPKIEQGRLADYYENIYRSKHSVMHIDFARSSLNMGAFDHNSLSQLFLGAQYLDVAGECRFLDIGAGYGYSFVSARKIFPCVRLFAVEANHDAAGFYKKYVAGISVYRHLSEITERMHMVLMSHSLEHFDVTDMPELFRALGGVLENNGIVVIEVPHVDLRGEFMRHQRFNDAPHLSFFSLESLRRLIEALGFEICFLSTVGELNTVSYAAEANAKKEKIFNAIPPGQMKSGPRRVRGFLKRVIQAAGLYDPLYELVGGLHWQKTFFHDPNYRYGGHREMIRCVIRKKQTAI